MSYNLRTFIDKGSGNIEQILEHPSWEDNLSRWLMRSRDEGVRKALIDLGWTPPDNKFSFSKSHFVRQLLDAGWQFTYDRELGTIFAEHRASKEKYMCLEIKVLNETYKDDVGILIAGLLNHLGKRKDEL